MNKKYNIIIMLIISVFFIPCMVNAEKQSEYCKVLSGDGKSAGTELACGTENFYIVENKNNTVKMLAKYNLLVGDKIDYFAADANQIDSNYCYDKATEKGYDYYIIATIYSDEMYQGYHLIEGCRVYESLNSQHIRQDSKAIGPKLDENNKTIYPLYGITYMEPTWGYEYYDTGVRINHQYDNNGDLVVSGSSFEGYLNGYKIELLSQNVEVSDVSFLTLNRIKELLKEVSGKDINVDVQYDDYTDTSDPNFDPVLSYIGKQDIREFVPNKHRWIHSVSYWLGSGYENQNDPAFVYNDYFIADVGLLCLMGSGGECTMYPYPVGVGVRPLVTISTSNIEYLIRTKTDGHGTIEVIDHSPGGESIKFRVNSNKGYKLDSVTITTDSGEKVSFREGEIEKNSDGTMSIDKNNFTMPFENVTIQAKWKIDIANPNTGFESVFMIFIILVSVISMTIIMKRKEIEEEII